MVLVAGVFGLASGAAKMMGLTGDLLSSLLDYR